MGTDSHDDLVGKQVITPRFNRPIPYVAHASQAKEKSPRSTNLKPCAK